MSISDLVTICYFDDLKISFMRSQLMIVYIIYCQAIYRLIHLCRVTYKKSNFNHLMEKSISQVGKYILPYSWCIFGSLGY